MPSDKQLTILISESSRRIINLLEVKTGETISKSLEILIDAMDIDNQVVLDTTQQIDSAYRVDKPCRISFTLTDYHRQRVRDIAKDNGITISHVIRSMIALIYGLYFDKNRLITSKPLWCIT